MSDEIIIKDPAELLERIEELHPSDIASSLKKIKKIDSSQFYDILEQLPDDILGDVLLELPETIREETYRVLSIEQLTDALEELESDDATDIIQEIEEIDEKKAKEIFEGLEEEDQQDINRLKRYDEEEAGAFMQTELFSAQLQETIGESIKRLKKGKEEEELENIHQVFVINDEKVLLASILLEDLIIFNFKKTYEEIINSREDKFRPFKVQDNVEIDDVAKKFEKYDLSVVAVTDSDDKLIGRITSDDILDVIEQNATEQIYQLAGVDEEYEHEEGFITTSKKRAMWLSLNLVTAILASIVIGLFESTIQQYIALAVLMPIVASMGGNAGTQTLAVMVRQLALGEIDIDNSRDAVKKEIFISIFNGLTFALIMGVIASIWFHEPMLGIVIGLSMIISLFSAGLFGASIPLLLKKFDIDPAVGSTVLLTTVTDIVGFFSFLGLAKIILL